MRSDKIHLALSYGNTRFEICNMIAKGMRATHAAGQRTEESIDRVLDLIGPKMIGPRLPTVSFPRARKQAPAHRLGRANGMERSVDSGILRF